MQRLYLTIKKLNLKIANVKIYHDLAYQQGIPVQGLENLKDQLFGLEANFEELKGVDFKKRLLCWSRKYCKNEIKKQTEKKINANQS